MTFPKPVSKTQREKRKEQQRLYSQKRRYFLNQKQNRFCNARVDCNPRFPNVANQVHHMRGRDGDRLLDESEWLAICPKCHDWVESNRAEAYARGLLLKRN